MDKSWTLESKKSIAYEEGVKQFLDFAFANAVSRERIKCPCKNCSNVYYRSRDEVYEHLICDGFENGYGCGVWVFHGEIFASPHQRSPNATLDEDVPDEVDDMHGMLQSAFGIQNPESSSQELEEDTNAEAVKFYKLVEDADQELYPGCKNFTKRAFVVRLYHIKCLNGWSDKSFTMLLELLKEAFLEGETLPKSFYETKPCRDGQLVDQASEDVMRQLNERLSQHLEAAAAEAAEARAAAVESARIVEMERAQRIALQEEVVQMRTQLNQLMTWMQSFTGSGPSSSSSVLVFSAAPNDIQRDG